MEIRKLRLIVLDGRFTVCRLDPDAGMPPWARGGGFVSITRTADELSVVCPEGRAPEGVVREDGWRVIRVEGKLDFSETGILASLAGPLAAVGISVFAVSTYDTDYLLVKTADLVKSMAILVRAGHTIADVGIDSPDKKD
jgi:hypothetical protein